MCRFAVYLGPPIRLAQLVVEAEHSIIRQSVHSLEGLDPMQGDGYGLAWYAPRLKPEPVLFREVTPAWNSPNLHSLADGIESGAIFAHVRAATEGSAVTVLNCHPFAHGPLAFMHNGLIGGFRRLRRALCERLSDEAYDTVQGTTDSEHLFAWFSDLWKASRQQDPLERLAEALAQTIRALDELRRSSGVEEPCRLNLAVTDGRRAVVSRLNLGTGGMVNSLYVHRGAALRPRDTSVAPPARPSEPCVLVVSEPLTSGDDWQSVPEGSLVLVDERRGLEIRPFAP
jgi:predicted glutamine amidotransferase